MRMLPRFARGIPSVVVMGALIVSTSHDGVTAPRHVLAIVLAGAVTGAWWLASHRPGRG